MNKEEYEGLKRYLKLEILQNCKVINEKELEEIEYLTKYDSVKDLVDSHNKLENGLITEDEFDEIHDKYRFMVANPDEEDEDYEFDDDELDFISNEVPTYSDGIIKREDLDQIIAELQNKNDNDNEEANSLDDDYKGLADYFRLEKLREKFPSQKIEDEIKNISKNNIMVERLEKAKQLLNEGEITKNSYNALRDFYKNDLEENIR